MDWSKTKKKLCIFIPNYHREEYLFHALQGINNNTLWSQDDYEIVIGCDGYEPPEIDKYYWNQYNRSIFGLPNAKTPRNGCFIRNYAIKNCQSQLFMQLDPEILFLRNLTCSLTPLCRLDLLTEFTWGMGPKSMRRIGSVATTTEDQYKDYREYGDFKDGEPVRRNLEKDTPYHWHHGMCIPTKILQEIGGYEEDLFPNFGMEDISLRERLIRYGCKESFVMNFTAVHLWHPQEPQAIDKVRRSQENYLKDRQLNPNKTVNNMMWGNG